MPPAARVAAHRRAAARRRRAAAPAPPPPPRRRWSQAPPPVARAAAPSRRRAPPPAPPASGPPALAKFVVRSGPRKGERVLVKVPIVNIGRADYNDIVLDDESVSSQHAKLTRREGLWILVDLGSTNGTMVDGERIEEDTPLAPGCFVRFGDVQLVFEPTDDDAGVQAPKATRAMQAIKLPLAAPQARVTSRPRAHHLRGAHRRRPDPVGERGQLHRRPGPRHLHRRGRDGRARGRARWRARWRCAASRATSAASRGSSLDEAVGRVTTAIRAANAAIFERTLIEHDKRGMGTTATVLILHANRYLIGHVGDSRAYLLRDGVFHQLTKDHSYVQEQVDAGYLTPEQARTPPVLQRHHPLRRRERRRRAGHLLRARAATGDVFLLASDGLTGMVEDDALGAILRTPGSPEKWVDRMVAEANRRGGLDNITAVIVRVDSVEVAGRRTRSRRRTSPCRRRD